MSTHWRQRPEGGGYLALWLIRSIGLYGGRRLGRLFLYPITLYFFLRRGPERRASRAYLSRVFGQPATAWQVLRHIHCFAAVILDRIFLLARGERGFEIETVGVEMLEAHLARGTGVMLIGSHVGSFEVLRALSARKREVPLRVVLNTRQAPAMTMLFDQLAPDIARHVIDGARDPASIVLAMSEAAAQGQMVALLADRGRPGESMRRVPFLGSPAPLPIGPWLLAAALKVPVVLCFGLYLGGNRYRLVFEHFDDGLRLPRRGRRAALEPLLLRYAARLQHYARLAPYNWFNFYDFWDDDGDAADARADDTATAAGDSLVR